MFRRSPRQQHVVQIARYTRAVAVIRRCPPDTTAAGGSTAAAPYRDRRPPAPEPARCDLWPGPDPTIARRPAMARPTSATGCHDRGRSAAPGRRKTGPGWLPVSDFLGRQAIPPGRRPAPSATARAIGPATVDAGPTAAPARRPA